jgi:hypothetical protein
MAPPEAVPIAPAQPLAKWTRSKGFELFEYSSLDHVHSSLGALASEAKASLLFLEYVKGEGVRVLNKRPVNLPRTGEIRGWMQALIGRSEEMMFYKIKKGCYWEISLVAQTGEYTYPNEIHGTAVHGWAAVSKQVALALIAFGRLTPAALARGLALSVPQVKGGAGSLISKKLIKGGRSNQPYEPIDPEALYEWLKESISYSTGTNGGAWLQTLVDRPWLLNERVAELKKAAAVGKQSRNQQ